MSVKPFCRAHFADSEYINNSFSPKIELLLISIARQNTCFKDNRNTSSKLDDVELNTNDDSQITHKLTSKKNKIDFLDDDTVTPSSQPTKKEITWDNSGYSEKEEGHDLGTQSLSWMLDRKASVGPVYQPGMPCEGPSGFAVFIPKKLASSINFKHPIPSVINISISKKCLQSKSRLHIDDTDEMKKKKEEEAAASMNMESKTLKSKIILPVREAISLICSRLKNAWND